MKTSHKFIIDATALIFYLLAANPTLTGLAVHEWMSLGIIIVFLVHCIANFDWIIDTIKKHKANASTANLVLDVTILVVFMVVTVSGLMVSRHVLPLLGFVAPGYFFWSPLHSIAAKVMLALLLVHVVVHFKWVATLRRRKGQKNTDEGVAHE
jgi:hypothetical protein